MPRIINYPKTGKTEPNTFFISDNPTIGTKAIEAQDLALALLQYTTGGYKIALVDELPPVSERDPMMLYFLRKEET